MPPPVGQQFVRASDIFYFIVNKIDLLDDDLIRAEQKGLEFLEKFKDTINCIMVITQKQPNL